MAVRPLDEDRIAEGLEALAAGDADMARALRTLGPPEPRIRPPGFATLLQIITAQQVSTKSAAAIWGRLQVALGEVTPDRVLTQGEAGLRAAGLSRPKAAYALGLAGAVASGALDLDALETADDEAAIASIMALKGFGRWSAEIYLLFALGRADVFPADDLAIRVALGRLKTPGQNPDAKAARAMAEAWRPWRGCAALVLWRCYGAATLDQG